MKKKVLALLLAAMMSLSLVACGGDKGNTSSTGSTGGTSTDGLKGKVNVQLVGWNVDKGQDSSTGREYEGYRAFFKREFEDKNPNVKVDMQLIPWDNAQQKGQVSLSSGDIDVAYTGAYSSQFYYAGILKPIDDLLKKDTAFKPEEIYAKGLWENSFSIQGFNKEARFGLPAILGNMYTVYDSKIFDDFGVEHFGDKITVDDLIAAAKATTGTNPKTGVQNYGLYFLANRSTDIFLFVACSYANGATGGTGNLADPKNIKWDLTSKEMVATMEDFGELVKYTPPGLLNGQGGEKFGKAINVEQENDVAIVTDTSLGGVWARYLKYEKKDKTEMDRFIATSNIGPNGEGWVACDPIVMSAKVKDANLDAAWAVMKFLASKETQEYNHKEFRYTPCTADTSFVDKENEGTLKAIEIAGKAHYTLIDEANPFYVSNIIPALGLYMSDIKEGKSTDINKILSELQAQAEQYSKDYVAK